MDNELTSEVRGHYTSPQGMMEGFAERQEDRIQWARRRRYWDTSVRFPDVTV